jgi:hypothetical protein
MTEHQAEDDREQVEGRQQVVQVVPLRARLSISDHAIPFRQRCTTAWARRP